MTDWTGPGQTTSQGYSEYPPGPGVGIARSVEGGGYLYKQHELLVAFEDLADVQLLLREWHQPMPYLPEPLAPESRWVRLTLGPDSIPVARLVADIRSQERPGTGKPPYRVSPNHVLRGNSHGRLGGPASPPEPTPDALSPPPPNTPGVGNVIRVAVLDTGELIKHDWFNGRVQRLGQGPTPPIPFPEGYLPDPLPRYAGHGTFVAGIVLQHAPHAQVLVGQALNGHGEVSDTDLAAIIRNLPANIDVLHLSCVGATAYDMGLVATEEALAEAWQRNPKLVVVAGAGNGWTDRPWYPGALKGVVCVAALGSEHAKAGFSNWGPWVDVAARGIRVKSTFLFGTTTPEQTDVLPGLPAPEHPGEEQTFDGWAHWSGTSFAAARVTGGIAEIAARPGMDAPRAAFELFGGGRSRLNDSGFDLGVPVFPPSWT